MEWDDRSQRIIDDTRNAIEQSSSSITRAQQILIESEQIGTEILSDLDVQRESLLRSRNRLYDVDEHLSNSARMIRSLKNNVLYNKILLILIIILEILVLCGLLVIKLKK